MPNRVVRSRIPFGGARSSKRSTLWAICSVPTGYSTLAFDSKAIAVLVPSSTLLDLVPFTITRTIGRVSIISDQQSVNENQIGAYGMGVVNRVAGALGATGIPGPATDCGWPGWFVFGYITQRFTFVSAVGVEPNMATAYDFDSRAQRKIESEQDLAFMVENFSGAHGLEFAVSFRMLIKAG